jgi:CRP-like cAMP-binding protein
MSFKLREVTFRVRCTEPGCPFDAEFTVRENIMGATEADVDSEAWKIARNMAFIRHDSIHGRKHPLANPEMHKIGGRYDRMVPVEAPSVPTAAPAAPQAEGALSVRRYRKGEKIIRKGESAITVCEVIRGSAHNEKRPELFYQTGSTFGAAALFEHKNRLADIVAGQDDTVIAFYNMRELSKSHPAKARELYNAAMEDIFDILTYLEGYTASLEKQLARARTAKPAKAVRGVAKASKKAPAKKAVRQKPAAKKSAKPAGKKPAAKPSRRSPGRKR